MWPLTSPRLPRLGLALQGGGAHGAFTWGVLDALLEHGGHEWVAISGTSAGAMNAVALAHGLLDGGADGARASLARFWQAVGALASFEWSILGEGDQTAFSPAARLWMQWTQFVSPYQRLNPDGDPLRGLLEQQIDFERLRQQHQLQLFIAATHANSGRLRVFRTPELSIDMVLASACLPTLSKAVLVDGEPYWDGGYSANPALFPLVQDSAAGDILLVLLSPWHFGATPQTVAEIRARAMDIGFNAAFLREMHALAAARERASSRLWRNAADRRLAQLNWHLIDGAAALTALAPESRMITHGPFLEHLRDAGRAHGLSWLQQHGSVIGKRSSADLSRLFGGPHALPPAATDPPA